MELEISQTLPVRRDSIARIPRRTTSTAQFEVSNPEDVKKVDEIAEVIAKIMILGDSGTGKSQLFSRLRKKPYNANSVPTPGIDFATHIIKISDGKHMRAQIVDTSGLDRYRTIVQNYWSLARGAMVVFDVSSHESFSAVRSWVRDFKAKACPPGSGRPKPSIMIVGNKIDVGEERKLSTQEAQAYATANGFFYTETSAKDDVNVDVAFNVLLTDVYFEVIKDKKRNEDGNQGNSIKSEEGGFVETTIAKIGRSLAGTRRNTIHHLGERSGSPKPDEGRLSPFPSRPGTPNSGLFRRGSLLLGPPQNQQTSSAPTLNEQILSGAQTLWKWVGEVVDDLVDEIEGVVEDRRDEDSSHFDMPHRTFQFPQPSVSYDSSMVGVVTPPSRQSRGSRSESDSGSYPGYDTDNSDEGQIVVDFFRGRSPSAIQADISPRSDSSHHSGSPPLSPSSPTSTPALLSPPRGKLVILPRKASLAPRSIPLSHFVHPPDSPSCGPTDILSESSVSDLNEDPNVDTKTELKKLSQPANEPNLMIEVSTLMPVGPEDSNIGARSLLSDDHFVPSTFLSEPRATIDSIGNGSDTFIEDENETSMNRKPAAQPDYFE